MVPWSGTLMTSVFRNILMLGTYKQGMRGAYIDKLIHNLVEDYFCSGLVPLRTQVFSRYPAFVNRLKESSSAEVRFLVNLVQDDPKSKTCRNIKYLNEITDENCLTVPHFQWKQILPKKTMPMNDGWRRSLLDLLSEARQTKDYTRLNLTETQLEEMFISLCISW